MTARCPGPAELTALLDGECTENRGEELRRHLGGCTACAAELEVQRRLVARLSAQLVGVPSPGAAAALMARLDGPAPARPRLSLPRWALGAGLAVAATVAVLVVALPRPDEDSGTFTARGGAAAGAHAVGIEVFALERTPRKLLPGSAVLPETAFVTSYGNARSNPAYLLLFAVDAAGAVHWLHPAYEDPATDPASVPLAPSVLGRALPDAIVLDGVAPGPLRVVSVVSGAPLAVSEIEALPPAELAPAALRARFAHAEIEELPLTVTAPGPERGPRTSR